MVTSLHAKVENRTVLCSLFLALAAFFFVFSASLSVERNVPDASSLSGNMTMRNFSQQDLQRILLQHRTRTSRVHARDFWSGTSNNNALPTSQSSSSASDGQ